MELKCICPVCGEVAGVESRDCIVAQHRQRREKAALSCGGVGQPAGTAIDKWIVREIGRAVHDAPRRVGLERIAAKRKGGHEHD